MYPLPGEVHLIIQKKLKGVPIILASQEYGIWSSFPRVIIKSTHPGRTTYYPKSVVCTSYPLFPLSELRYIKEFVHDGNGKLKPSWLDYLVYHNLTGA